MEFYDKKERDMIIAGLKKRRVNYYLTRGNVDGIDQPYDWNDERGYIVFPDTENINWDDVADAEMGLVELDG